MQKNDSADKPSNDLGAAAKSILTSLERDWREMCGNELRPTHASLEPLRMEETLPYAFVLKRTGPGAAHIRVAGQRVHDFFNEDLAGFDFARWFRPQAAELAAELLEATFTLPAITSFGVLAKSKLCRPSVHGQIILLPMRDGSGNVSRILGAMITDGGATPYPLRLDIDHSHTIRCEPQNGIFPDRRSRQRDEKPAHEKRGHLRLVVDNA